MKGKAIARQGFCDVYQEGDGEPLPYLSIDWRKQPVGVSVLIARITRLLSQEIA